MTETKTMTCILCPRGCELEVTLENGRFAAVKGNTCARGKGYAQDETTHPVRTLTTTVRMTNGGLLPVKTSKPLPKELLFRAMEEVNRLMAPADTEIGTVLLADLLGTGADVVATADGGGEA
ncbi:MAG: DUF1667 domain-containing protein [Eubacteriales bacterium]